jgi:hypothetical protein
MPSEKFNGIQYDDLLPRLSTKVSAGMVVPKGMPSLPRPRSISPGQNIQEPDTDNMIGLNLLRASSGYPTGAGYCAALLDTGVATHPRLAGKIILRTTIHKDETDIDDLHGHGTSMAGIICGPERTFSGMGIAPDAKIVSVKITNKNSGSTSWSSVYEGLKKVYELATKPKSDKSTPEISVVNLSFNGLDYYLGNKGFESTLIFQAIDALAERNIPVVISSGNQYMSNTISGLGYPACGSTAIHAGATINYDFISVLKGSITKSSQRIKSKKDEETPDAIVRKGIRNFIHAPGAVAVSLSNQFATGPDIIIQTGTSVSAAVITSCILLIQQSASIKRKPDGTLKYPGGITVNQIKELLVKSCIVFCNKKPAVKKLSPGIDWIRTMFASRPYFDYKMYGQINVNEALKKL